MSTFPLILITKLEACRPGTFAWGWGWGVGETRGDVFVVLVQENFVCWHLFFVDVDGKK
jgi:hypothetical protein